MELLLVVLAVAGAILAFRIGFARGQRGLTLAAPAVASAPAETVPSADPPPPLPTTAPTGDPAEPGPPPTIAETGELLRPAYDSVSHPRELESNPAFEHGVAMLADPQVPLDVVVDHCIGANPPIAAMAAAALARRTDSGPALERVARHLRHAYVWTTFYALRYIDARAEKGAVCRVLLETPDWWLDNPLMPGILDAFIAARMQKGETLDLAAMLAWLGERDLGPFEQMLRKLTTPHAEQLRMQLADWRATRIDRGFLGSVGRIAADHRDAPPIVAHTRLDAAVAAAAGLVLGTPPRSCGFAGEAGVGKRTAVRALTERLQAHGWTVFEASASEVLAGMVYIGELENRAKRLVDALDVRRRVVWHVPNVHELFYAGRHRYSPTGLLDLLMPAIESGRVVVVGTAEPAALERVLRERPRLRTAFRFVALEPLPAPEALDLAGKVLQAKGIRAEPGIADEALDLARHYLGTRALPGSVLDLLRAAAERAKARAGAALDRADLLASLGDVTGLPREVLDERAGLDPAGLRAHFAARVMGQPEAVDCLVDRIAMLKAGLTDARRPIGVFLFAGPTGTGKTEVAKTLAAFVFGSPERMVRLDMSEFQEVGSLGRIIGEPGDANAAGEALVDQIRKQPFSVVLLDEFEKAHPRVWDLFLQVFDDGRLTDARGAVADFRHAIVILTSNLGATSHRGSSLGFVEGGGAFADAQVLRTIAQTFRPEFVNRIDRVVVFRPLSKAVMRDILRKELADVLQRRGFRSRDWAVEWEESAIEFLLERGFTPDMGARPLRRAIEQYVLAPIAMTIVEHRFPEGDQFLFVRSDGHAIQVEFVDPDAEPSPPGGEAPAGAPPAAIAPRLAALEERLDGEAWSAEKDVLLRDINRPEFWSDPRRFAVLDRLERMDRIGAGLQAARSLARRVAGGATQPVATSLAEQLHLLEAALADLDAGHGSEVWLAIEPVAGDGDRSEAGAWSARVVAMYVAWAKKRRMRLKTLEERAGRAVFAIAGFGAHHLLAPEAGLHVLEVPDGESEFARVTARVKLAEQPVAPLARDADELQAATAALAAGASATAVVRRYRQEPSPLVRDSVKGWRTGRLDVVLGGDFDLLR